MKHFALAALFLAGMGLLSMKTMETGNARANKRSGVDVYVFSEPVREYEVIEADKLTIWADCEEIFNKAVKNAAKRNADGVIIYTQNARCEYIRYK